MKIINKINLKKMQYQPIQDLTKIMKYNYFNTHTKNKYLEKKIIYYTCYSTHNLVITCMQ